MNLDYSREPHAMFSVPFFVEQVDLDKIDFNDNPTFAPSFLSGVNSSLSGDSLTDESYEYLGSIISECIGRFSDKPFAIGQVWRNEYKKEDWQDPHIHSGAQWSFIIYDTVQCSKTVFMNPARKEYMNQWGMYAQTIPMDFIPEIPSGGMIIFPSWIEHFVMSGNEGSTISGNIYLVDPPMGPQ